ncbi:MAG: hypothetical protein APR62_12690 [Smithella sp. SDB]|nr:MAG: hypothetical protein APR62_12690 [Smithella sp. SDB]
MNSRTDLKTGTQKRILNSLGSFVDSLFIVASRLADHLRPRRIITREAYEQQIDYYIDNGYADNPESFFAFPAKAPAYSILERKPYHDGEYQLIGYQSGYTTKNPLIRDYYDSFSANKTGYLVRWTHVDKQRKTILCHHGYMLGEPRQAKKMFRINNLYDKGLDVVLFIAPFHWKRQPGPFTQRGIYMQPDDVVMTCEAVGQTIYDLYGSFLILSELDAPEIGLIGASLGGHIAALLASLTTISSFAAMMVPAINFTDPMDPDHARLPFSVDGSLRKKMWRVWELHSPLHFSLKLPRERLLVVASRGDRLCPFEHVRMLCEKWDIKNRRFLTGGHWLIFNRSERGRAWYNFLLEMGFLD